MDAGADCRQGMMAKRTVIAPKKKSCRSCVYRAWEEDMVDFEIQITQRSGEEKVRIRKERRRSETCASTLWASKMFRERFPFADGAMTTTRSCKFLGIRSWRPDTKVQSASNRCASNKPTYPSVIIYSTALYMFLSFENSAWTEIALQQYTQDRRMLYRSGENGTYSSSSVAV